MAFLCPLCLTHDTVASKPPTPCLSTKFPSSLDMGQETPCRVAGGSDPGWVTSLKEAQGGAPPCSSPACLQS